MVTSAFSSAGTVGLSGRFCRRVRLGGSTPGRLVAIWSTSCVGVGGFEHVFVVCGVLGDGPVVVVDFVVAAVAYEYEVVNVGWSIVRPILDVVCAAP